MGLVEMEGGFPGWREMAVVRGDVNGLAELAAAERHFKEYFEDRLRHQVFWLRYRQSPFLNEPDGAKWAEIAEALGCSRQAAQQRFGEWVGNHRDELIDEELARKESGTRGGH